MQPTSSDFLSSLVHQLHLVLAEAELLLRQQKEMTETHLSDLQQWRDGEKIEKLKKETAKLRSSLKKSKEEQKRRRELENKRKQTRRSF